MESFIRPLPEPAEDALLIDFVRDNVMNAECFQHFSDFIVHTVDAPGRARELGAEVHVETGLHKQENYEIVFNGKKEIVNGYVLVVTSMHKKYPQREKYWRQHCFFLIANAYNFLDRIMTLTPPKEA